MALAIGGALNAMLDRGPTIYGGYGTTPLRYDPVSIPPAQVIPPLDSFQALTRSARALDTFGISIDFVGSGTSLSVDEIAGIVPLGWWNELRDATGSNNALVDSSGAPIVKATISWYSGDGWFDVQPNNPNSHMFSGYIEQNGAPEVQGTVVVSVSSLPQSLAALRYAVIVYSDKMGNPEDQVTRLEITAGALHQTFYLRDAAFHDYPLRNSSNGYVVATGTEDERTRTPIANCAIFKNVSSTDFEIKVSTTPRTRNNAGGYLRSPINGMQILPMAALAKIGLSANVK